jgi:hypothetical protein
LLKSRSVTFFIATSCRGGEGRGALDKETLMIKPTRWSNDWAHLREDFVRSIVVDVAYLEPSPVRLQELGKGKRDVTSKIKTCCSHNCALQEPKPHHVDSR